MTVATKTTHVSAAQHCLDVLETDGGWLTSDGIQLCIRNPIKEETLWSALYTLAKKGHVERRTVLLSNNKGFRWDTRIEWRHL